MRLALLLILLAPAGARALEVRILEPAAGEPLLGHVAVRAEVSPAGTRIDRVEFFLDGMRAAVAERAPYRAVINAGDEGRDHRLEVVAIAADGTRATAVRMAPRFQVDAELRVDLQQLFVTVDRGGRPAPSLRKDDFTVFDQGEPQPIVTFGRGDVPFTAVLLLDASASMEGRRLERALEGARSFFAALAPLDEAKLILFSDHVILETPFTSVQSILTLGLRDVKAVGGTALNDALYLAVKRLEARKGRKIAVLLSDGVDVESVLSIEETQAIARRQVTLYWLRLSREEEGHKVLITSPWRSAEEHASELSRLRAAVAESGGRILDIAGADEIPPTLAALLRELRDQYVLGIAPRHTQGGSGTWHPVRVEVKGSATARTQDGYFEP